MVGSDRVAGAGCLHCWLHHLLVLEEEEEGPPCRFGSTWSEDLAAHLLLTPFVPLRPPCAATSPWFYPALGDYFHPKAAAGTGESISWCLGHCLDFGQHLLYSELKKQPLSPRPRGAFLPCFALLGCVGL